jgi:hypothetical protein
MTDARPAPVRLDDLVRPRFPPGADEIVQGLAAEGASIVLDLDDLVSRARADTGLDDLGGDELLAPLGVLCDALEHEAGLSDLGRYITHDQLVQLLSNRLLVTDLLARHPEIHDVEVRAPLIIAGLPRTGTTHLHNLLAADPRLRSLPYWESLEPVPAPSEQPAGDRPDPRRVRTDTAVEFMDLAMPHFARMHEMTTDHVHEEVQLLAISGSTMLFDTIAPMPTWRRYYRDHDQTPHYEYLKTLLKVLQFLRGGDRWVLKSPQHLEQFAVLRRVFPDATVVVTHRDPVSVTLSMATMVAYTSRMTHDPVPVEAIGRYWAGLLDEMLTTCASTRELLGDDAVDVHFDQFMADDMGTVARIYGLAGLPLTDEARDAMGAYIEDHPRGRHGTVVYDFDDLGLDPAELRRRFAGYVDYFGVTIESTATT